MIARHLLRLVGAIAAVLPVYLLSGTMPAGAAQQSLIFGPGQTVDGSTLARAVTDNAYFQSSFFNEQYLPKTPYQTLYAGPGDEKATQVGSALRVDASRSFTVSRGTIFFLPLTAADDSQSVLGRRFPKKRSGAVAFWYQQATIGATGAVVSIDGKSIRLGHGYLVGPRWVAKLADGAGHHIIQEAAFIRALSPGLHTVAVHEDFNGLLYAKKSGFSSTSYNYTFSVTVLG